MTRGLGIAGIGPEELVLIRLLVSLLRHPDPSVAELAKQALYFVRDSASRLTLDQIPEASTAT